MKKKLIVWLSAFVLTLALMVPIVFANNGPHTAGKPEGVKYDSILTVSSAQKGAIKFSSNNSTHYFKIVDGVGSPAKNKAEVETHGGFYFTLDNKKDTTVTVVGDVWVRVEAKHSNWYAVATLDNDGFEGQKDYLLERTIQVGTSGQTQGMNHLTVLDYGANNVVGKDPIIVDLGFIGHYLFDGRVLTTSFYWQRLEEGDMIDWDAVDAAYADWYAKGGLKADRTDGWKSSGFAPLFFEDYAPKGHGDFAYEQLEGYYRAYFVATDYELPVVKGPEVPCAGPEGECRGDCDYTCEYDGFFYDGDDCICDDCAGHVCTEVYFFTTSGWMNFQGGNNGRMEITVDGVKHELRVNAQQGGKGTYNITVAGNAFTVFVESNQNNQARATVTAVAANTTHEISVRSLTTGNQQ